MRVVSSLTASLAVLAGCAELTNASLAYVLTFDPQSAQGKHQIALASLSPEISRLVLAQRAGVEDYHTPTTPGDAEIEVINKYGARSSIFQSDKPESRAFILAELPEEHDSHTKLRLYARFTIQNSPDFEASQELFQDLYAQSHPGKTISSADLQSQTSIESSDLPSFHVASDANELIKLARTLAAEKVSVTALLVPAGSRGTGWGTYNMPGRAKVAKRQSPHRLEPEEPITESFEDVPSPARIEVTASNSSSNYTNDKPLRGVFPMCFSSQRSCETNTRGCTGHGQCEKKWTNTDHPDSSKGGECWSCTCSPTKSNGVTTVWAGPACQKKDISAQFWLIALFSIGLVALVSFAVGNLLSMGEQELPSVIGAGVSGPSARK